jgi:hypothetical protein
MMPSGDDHALLSQIATGDEGALQQLFVEYRPPLASDWHRTIRLPADPSPFIVTGWSGADGEGESYDTISLDSARGRVGDLCERRRTLAASLPSTRLIDEGEWHPRNRRFKLIDEAVATWIVVVRRGQFVIVADDDLGIGAGETRRR